MFEEFHYQIEEIHNQLVRNSRLAFNRPSLFNNNNLTNFNCCNINTTAMLPYSTSIRTNVTTSSSARCCGNPRPGCECTSDFVSHIIEKPRQPNFSTYSVRCPTPPPIVERYVERAPTPEPDIIEKVLIKPQPQKYIERIIEKPRVPPPIIKCKEVIEPPKPPIYKTKIVDVDYTPRSRQTSECDCCCDCYTENKKV